VKLTARERRGKKRQNIEMVKVNVNFTLEQATKAHKGSREIALHLP
jgi:hypothetical protein